MRGPRCGVEDPFNPKAMKYRRFGGKSSFFFLNKVINRNVVVKDAGCINTAYMVFIEYTHMKNLIT